MVYTHLGQWDEALREGEISLKVAGDYSNDSLISFAAFVTSKACCYKGEISKAIEFGNLAVRKASSPVDYLWSRTNLAWVLGRAGEPEKDIEFLIKSAQNCRKAGAHIFAVFFGVDLGEGYFLNHQYNKAKHELESTLKLAEENGMKFWAACCHRLLGEISIATDPAQEKRPSGESYFENAISICREIKAENLLAESYAGLGRYYKLLGNIPAAKDYLNQALETFERLGTLHKPDKVKEELAELSEA